MSPTHSSGWQSYTLRKINWKWPYPNFWCRNCNYHMQAELDLPQNSGCTSNRNDCTRTTYTWMSNCTFSRIHRMTTHPFHLPFHRQKTIPEYRRFAHNIQRHSPLNDIQSREITYFQRATWSIITRIQSF